MGLLDAITPKPPMEKYRDCNPKVVVHATQEEARIAAIDEASKSGGVAYNTSGTSSMEPLIVGKVYVVGTKVPYDQIKEGQVANYRAKWAAEKGAGLVLHRLLQKDKDGWIASGDNNSRSENWGRVKPDNYVDVITTIHTYKGAEKTRVKP